MGKSKQQYFQDTSPDVPAKEFWRNNERFADLFNAVFFAGKELIKSEDLQEMDTDVSKTILSSEFQKILNRTRDVIKMSTGNAEYQILAVENQQAIHYGMPLRCLLYDGLTYLKRIEDLAKSNRENRELHGTDEFLSGIQKTDKLIPCYTLVVYWGEKHWDGPRTLKDMMQFDRPDMIPFFCDYSMNLVCVNEAVNYPFHNKDVKDLFQAVRDMYQTGGKQMSESLRDVRLDVAYTAAVITGTTQEYSSILQKAFELGKERINMCEAVKQAFAEERKEGMRVGRQEALKQVALKLLKKENDNYDAVANMLDISADQIKKWEQE